MPQDSLTLRFQEQLRRMRKTGGITDITPPPTQDPPIQRRQGGSRTLAEMAGMEGDWQQQPDESGNLLTALAKGTWAGVEIATLGIPKLLYTPIEKTTGFDEIVQIEEKYLDDYLKKPVLTDIKLFFTTLSMIIKGTRST